MTNLTNIYSYSIYIRTLGKGGEKYTRLLRSIDAQTVRPAEVVVVLPIGYEPPEERLGYERFAYSEKGMVRQRLFAISDARTPYVLLLDDDVEFEPQYVEKMFATMKSAGAQCCIPILKDESKSASKLKRAVNRFIGCEVYKNTNDNFFMKINRCGGFVVNTKLLPDVQYYSQTGHGSNCFAETKTLRDIHFEEELWLEDSGYALPDDQVMFYKIHKTGHKIAVCRDAYFCHLNAASTNDGRRYLKVAQAKAGNYLIFWYRFIYPYTKGSGKVLSIFSIMHRIFWECLMYMVKCHNLAVCKNLLLGLRRGFGFIKGNGKYRKI